MDLHIALSLGTETRARLGALQDRLLRFSPDTFKAVDTTENLRLVIVSLDGADDERVEAAKSAMSAVSFLPFKLTLDQVGWSPRDGGTWWVRASESPELVRLQSEICGHLGASGILVPSQESATRIVLGQGPEGDLGPTESFGETVSTLDLIRPSYVGGKLVHLCIFRKGQWKKPIVIEPYTPQWEQEFRRLEARLLSVLQGTSAKIHHVGSTSVPGLWAKPILDVDIEIDGMWEFPDVARRLRSLGYRHEGDYGIPGREAMKYDKTDYMTHHLYVCPSDSAELERHLLFRDYLWQNPEAVREYGELKVALADRHQSDIDGYIDGKSKFIEDCLDKVRSERPSERPSETRWAI